MPKIRCCQCEQEATDVKEIVSIVEGCKQIYLFLACCIKCGGRSVKLITIDAQNRRVEERRIKKENIDSFFKKVKVVKEFKPLPFQKVKQRPFIVASEHSRRVARRKR